MKDNPIKKRDNEKENLNNKLEGSLQGIIHLLRKNKMCHNYSQ